MEIKTKDVTEELKTAMQALKDHEYSKSASVRGSEARGKPVKDYGDKELIDLALQLHARACAFTTPELHDRAMEARIELLRRLREKP